MSRFLFLSLLVAAVIASSAAPAFSQTGSRPAYIYDYTHIISGEYENLIDSYVRGLDDSTTNEIVIYTIPSFAGHSIEKDGVEIQDRDMLANYIYNEVSLDGIKGVGKKGKDNGILILLSLERDAGGDSMRIEVGRGLAGDIDAQLQRRYDLIPNLVNAVKGYLQFEKSVLEDVTRLRTDWQRATTVNERVELSNQIEEALSKIILTFEAYPDLKSDQVVVRLMDELAGTENRIAVARTYYNDGVRDYNTNLRTFPNNAFNESGFLGVKPWGLKPYTPYEATQAAQTTVPQIDITVP